MKLATEMKPILAAFTLALGLSSCGETKKTNSEPQEAGKSDVPEIKAQTGSPASEGADRKVLAVNSQEPSGFAQCKVCHSVEKDGPAGVGPNLFGIFGKAAASKEGYTFSPAIKESKIVWDKSELDTFLESPAKMVPGTKMAFAGLNDPKQRAEIVGYLKSLQ